MGAAAVPTPLAEIKQAVALGQDGQGCDSSSHPLAQHPGCSGVETSLRWCWIPTQQHKVLPTDAWQSRRPLQGGLVAAAVQTSLAETKQAVALGQEGQGCSSVRRPCSCQRCGAAKPILCCCLQRPLQLWELVETLPLLLPALMMLMPALPPLFPVIPLHLFILLLLQLPLLLRLPRLRPLQLWELVETPPLLPALLMPVSPLLVVPIVPSNLLMQLQLPPLLQ